MNDPKMTVVTIDPMPTRRPDAKYVSEYLDLATKTACNATLNLPFSAFCDPSAIGDCIRSGSPDLFDKPFCQMVLNGLRIEVRNNYLRYADINTRNQYTTTLKREIQQFLIPALTTLESLLDHLNGLEREIKATYGVDENVGTSALVGFYSDPQRKHIEDERNALQGPFFTIREWKELIEQYVSDFSPAPLTTDTQPPEPGKGVIELEEEGYSTNIRVLLAYQSGILTGTFDKLPPEKQAAVLSVLFGKSLGNVRKSLSALANGTVANNPQYMPKVVEKANDLIVEQGLGIPLIKNHTKS